MMATRKRRALAKGKWMKLRDPAVLQAFISAKSGMNQSKLAEYVGCERQFISALLNPTDRRKGCTPKLAEAIEDVLGAPRGTIFSPGKSTEIGNINPSSRPTRAQPGKLRVA